MHQVNLMDSANKCGDITAPSASEDRKIQITAEDNVEYFDGRRIHRVPERHRLKKHKEEEDYYTPKFVSFGPYHHGSPQLSAAEAFKPQVLEPMINAGSNTGLTREILYSEVFNVIDQIRNCYVEVDYNDELLTNMILLDSCFFISLMQMNSSEQLQELEHQFDQLFGISAFSYVYQDMYLLENQIPLWVIQLLVTLIYSNNKEQGLTLVCDFFSDCCFPDRRLKSMPAVTFGNKQPLHLLDACRLIKLDYNNGNALVQKPKPVQAVSKCLRQLCLRGIRKEDQASFGELSRQFRSVTDLKAKGVFFRPSSYCLKDIEFKSYTAFAVLQLPRFLFTHNSKRFFLNEIAYELSPESVIGVDIIYYLNFMKSLILKPQDVRELREKKILFSSLESDEQVFQVIQEIDTFAVSGLGPEFDEVKDRIEEHCSSKTRTWIAEFLNTYFRSPWTVIALVAITFQLVLSVVQAYYAMHSAS